MILPHTVTVYNIGPEDPQTYEREVNITIIDGVFLDSQRRNSKGQTGAVNADTVTLHIPLPANAKDAFTGENKAFITPKAYRASGDKAGLWTLEPKDCFFVKGVCVDESGNFQNINKNFEEVYCIVAIDIKDFGSADMQHIEVTGR